MNDEYIGYNLMVDIYGCEFDDIENINYILSLMDQIVDIIGAKIIKKVNHKFTPQGISAAYIISESHITIHTWPENGYIGIDVFTCTKNFDIDEVIKYLVETVKHSHIKYKGLYRGSNVKENNK